MPLKALGLNCTLKSSPAESSTGLMLDELSTALNKYDVETEIIRVVDHDVRFGVGHDEGSGDEWPRIKAKLDAADIFVMGTPVWMGAPSSVCKMICERLDAYLSDTDDDNRMPTFGKVAILGVVGNEDGAHRVSADVYQWLNDVGFSIPPSAVAYWVGEAMQGTDFKDLDEIPEAVRGTIEMAASNAAHLAELLARNPYKGYSG